MGDADRAEEIKALAGQLFSVGYRGLRRAYDPSKNPLEIEIVNRIVGRLEPTLFKSDPARALKTVLDRAIEQLSDEPANPSYVEDIRLTVKDIGIELYATDLAARLSEIPSYKSRFKNLKTKVGLSVKLPAETLERAVEEARNALASTLLEMEQSALSYNDSDQSATTSAPSQETAVLSREGVISQASSLSSQEAEAREAVEQQSDGGTQRANSSVTSPDTSAPDADPPLATDSKKPPHSIDRRTANLWIGAVTAVLIAAIGFAVSQVVVNNSHNPPSNPPPPNSTPQPASSSSPPARIESVSDITNSAEDRSFVLPNKLDMNESALSNFGSAIYPNSKKFAPWYASHGGVAVDSGFINITLRGNAKSTVSITGMKVIKECKQPLSGAFFGGVTQGEDDSIGMAFNLDLPEPTPQAMARVEVDGSRILNEPYFKSKVITLEPDEQQSLTIVAFTEQSSCAFTFQMTVATPEGSFTQDLDHHGKPWTVTAKTPPTKPGHPLSGYESAYMPRYHNGLISWTQVDPATYKE